MSYDMYKETSVSVQSGVPEVNWCGMEGDTIYGYEGKFILCLIGDPYTRSFNKFDDTESYSSLTWELYVAKEYL